MSILFALVACNTTTNESIYADDPMGRITGQVADLDGQGLEGVEVSADGLTALTGPDGWYTLDGVSPGQSVVSFVSPGFAKNYKRVQLLSWETISADATLQEIDGFDVFDAKIGGITQVGDVLVDFGATSVVDTDGNSFDGAVTVEVTYLDPYTDDINFAPGDLTALAISADSLTKDANEPAQLVSYGMVDISLYDEDGNPLNVSEDNPAVVEMPVTNGDLPDVYRVQNGDPQATWSFSAEKGMWMEEGAGVVQENDDGDLVFTFEATHFSWWNCDQGFVPTCAYGKVTDVLGFPVRGARIDAQGGQSSSSVYTDDDGNYVVSVMVGDTVNFKGTTAVGGKNWSADHTVYLYGYGSSSADCQPIPEIEIEVCREAGIVMTDNLDLHVSGGDVGQNGDQLRAWFWEPPGDVWRCQDLWDKIDEGECLESNPADYPQIWGYDSNLDEMTRSAGEWLEFRTPRDTYHIDEESLDGNPVYMFQTIELVETKGVEIQQNDVDLRGGDAIRGNAPGSADAYFGAIENEEWVTIPEEVTLTNIEGPQGNVARSGGLNIRFDGKNNEDDMMVFITPEQPEGDAIEQGLLCRESDDGSIDISGGDLGNVAPGWASVSIYRPEFTWTVGPDGLPIRVQAVSGAVVEANLR
ncbi:MAG TPA: carboxypeptidase-like regulatory domain-containing protein [Myxococcota bacterium]|nr:carboxypeptidase-like regulatory domain-containing protein [Myxococcota bacterium]